MHELFMVITCLIITHHGSHSCRHGACARVHPCNADKPERSSFGSRHAPRTSPHQALSAFIFLRSDLRRTGNCNGNLCPSSR